jgi:hypothetical protein
VEGRAQFQGNSTNSPDLSGPSPYQRRAEPTFVQAILVHYNFERQQRIKVAVYDADEAATDVHSLQLSKQDYLGCIEFDLAEVARGKDSQMRMQLMGTKAQGWCTVRGEERVTFKRVLTVDMLGHKLARRDGCAVCRSSSVAALCASASGSDDATFWLHFS